MGTAVGVDVGATLAKLALREPGGELRFELLPSADLDAVADRLRELAPSRIGVTGGGAEPLAERLGLALQRVNEFAAWGHGASALLEREGLALRERYLLVSLGTGTSVLLVDGLSVTRVGGTALGGGTLLGLGALLLGRADFDELVALAERGERARVDLLVSDIYRRGEIALAGDLTAANFGKLAQDCATSAKAAPEDLAHALIGLVAENVALVCGGLAAAARVSRIVFGGSTLRGNAPARRILETIARALGLEPHFLPQGEHAGSLGALLLAAENNRGG